jgi:hypothetical protein
MVAGQQKGKHGQQLHNKNRQKRVVGQQTKEKYNG